MLDDGNHDLKKTKPINAFPYTLEPTSNTEKGKKKPQTTTKNKTKTRRRLKKRQGERREQ